mgnify:FL=1
MFLLVAALLYAGSESIIPEQGQAKPTVKISQIGIKKGKGKTVYLNDKLASVKAALGKPASVSSEYFEMMEKDATVLNYGSNKLYFVDDILESYDLTESNISVGQQGGAFFKIGDHINAVDPLIPVTALKNNWLSADIITESGTITDYFISIEVDPSVSKIKTIRINSY